MFNLDTYNISCQCYIFSGPRFSGKMFFVSKFIEKIENKYGKCEKTTFHDNDNSFGIDNVRDDILKNFFQSSYRSAKILIIENAERMTIEAQNAMLKFLEETPKNVFVIFTTTNSHYLLDTVLSRMRIFHFHLLSDDNLNKFSNTSSNEFFDFAGGRLAYLQKLNSENKNLIDLEQTKFKIFEEIFYNNFKKDFLFEFVEKFFIKNPKIDFYDFLISFVIFLRRKIFKTNNFSDLEKGLKILDLLNFVIKNANKNVNKKLLLENFFLEILI